MLDDPSIIGATGRALFDGITRHTREGLNFVLEGDADWIESAIADGHLTEVQR